MAQPAGESRQFFLGVGGSQTGPHTEEEILAKIAQGEVPRDALVWYEGLTDWQPIITVEYFSKGFGGNAAAGATPTTPTPAPQPAAPSPQAVAKVAPAGPTRLSTVIEPRPDSAARRPYRGLAKDPSEQL